MTPLEIRRRPPRLVWRLVAAQALVLVGGLLLVAATLVLVVLGHPGGAGLAQDIGLVALGVAFLVRGLRRLPATRALVARPVVLRLDDVGIEVLGGAVERPLRGRTSACRVPLVLDRLREHRPDVPVTDARDAAHPG